MTTTAAPTTTYLQRCIEESSPDNVTSLEVKSILWRTAAVATFVAYAALAIGAIAAAIAYFPAFVPVVAIGSLVAMTLVNLPYKYFDKKAEHAQAHLRRLDKISKHDQELASLNSQQLQTMLLRKGIHWFTIPGMVSNPERLETLRPFIARLNYCEKKREECEREMEMTREEVTKLTAENKPEYQEAIDKFNQACISFEQAALMAKISSAFMHAVILRPGFSGRFKTMGSFSRSSVEQRAIGLTATPAAAIDFYTFKNASKITYDEAKRMSVPELATRFIAAMPA